MAFQDGAAARKSQETAPRGAEWLVEAVETRLRAGKTYKQVAADLDKLRKQGRYDWTPEERTIRSWVAKGKVARPPRPTDPWSLLIGSAEDAALVLPVVPFAAALPKQGRWLTVREAEAIARIRRAAPDLPTASAATLAFLYVARERKRASAADLDLYLATGPWRDPDAQEAYEAAAEGAGVRPLWVSPIEPGEWLVSVKFGRATVIGTATARATATVSPKER